MTYRVKFAPAVRERIAGWGLPDSVLRTFYLRVADELEHASALKKLVTTAEGMQYSVVVEHTSERQYVFRLWLDRNDMEFQINFVLCIGMESGKKLFWTSS